MGVDFVNILFIHGPDSHYGPAIENAYPALAELRDDGVVKAIGAGMNQWEMELKFAQEGEFDCFLLANRYTLLEQGAITEFLPYCKKNDISVIIGGPYNSGVLANPGEGRYEYRAAPSEIVDRTLRLKGICEKYGVPLRAAALQFVLAHPPGIQAFCRSPHRQRLGLDFRKERSRDHPSYRRLRPRYSPPRSATRTRGKTFASSLPPATGKSTTNPGNAHRIPDPRSLTTGMGRN